MTRTAVWYTRDALDEWIVDTVHARNEYRLPDDMAGMRVLDIGGNIGAFARACLDRGARVLSVEPDPANAGVYRENLAGYDNWHCLKAWHLIQAALAERDGTVRLFRGVDAVGFTTAKDMTLGYREVQAVSFAGLLKTARAFWGPGRIDWCKVDAEGLEYRLVEEEAFLSCVDCLTVEFHDNYVDYAIVQAERTRQALARMGFREERWDEVHREIGWFRLYRGRRDLTCAAVSG